MFKKSVVLVLVGILSVCLVSGTSMARGQYADHQILWNQWDPAHNTINDWTKVGSAGYANYLTLSSYTENPADAVVWASNDNTSLTILGTDQVVPAGTWAGYQYTLPDAYAGQEISSAWIPGYWNYGGGVEMQITDAAGNILWSATPTPGWIQNQGNLMNATFSSASSTINIIVKVTQDTRLWGAGNFMSLNPMSLYTVDVPEPVTMSLLGLGSLALLRRKK